MSVEMGLFLGGMANRVFGSSGLNKIFGNIIYTSLILGIIILLVFVTIIPCTGETFQYFKAFFYVYITTFVILMAYSSVLKNKLLIKDQNKQSNEFITKVSRGGYDKIYENEIVKVQPKFASIEADTSELLDQLEQKLY